jgi:hypothetical protein
MHWHTHAPTRTVVNKPPAPMQTPNITLLSTGCQDEGFEPEITEQTSTMHTCTWTMSGRPWHAVSSVMLPPAPASWACRVVSVRWHNTGAAPPALQQAVCERCREAACHMLYHTSILGVQSACLWHSTGGATPTWQHAVRASCRWLSAAPFKPDWPLCKRLDAPRTLGLNYVWQTHPCQRSLHQLRINVVPAADEAHHQRAGHTFWDLLRHLLQNFPNLHKHVLLPRQLLQRCAQTEPTAVHGTATQQCRVLLSLKQPATV